MSPLTPLRMQLMTERLRLRPWRPEDREPFAAMNADPAVMEHFPSVLSRAQSDAVVDRFEAGFAERGWGFWAAELKDTGEFVGFIGLSQVRDIAPVAPAVEVGWRLAPAYWGVGLAPEGARAALSFGFNQVGLAEIVAFTTRRNAKSRRVMEKLGMTHDPADDFDDERYPDWPERRLVLYRLRAESQRSRARA